MLVEVLTMPKSGQFLMMWSYDGRPFCRTLRWVADRLYQAISPKQGEDLQWIAIDSEELPNDCFVQNIRYIVNEDD